MERLIQSFGEVWDDEISRGFLVLIVFVFLFSLIAGIIRRWLKNDEAAYRLGRFLDFSPGAMTTIGVIGTFVGIFFGLIDFDVQNIDSSVPDLLSGLKIAFGTSIIGMMSAISFRLIEQSARIAFGSRPTSTIDDDPVPLLAKMNNLLVEQNKSLGGDGDSSILTTLRLSRSDANDAARKQIEALEAFAETLKESATGAIVKALEDVIRDFNDKITEQFGDNFKQLNQAVGALNTWQKNYKEQVSATEDRIKAQTETIETIKENLAEIADSIAGLSESANAFPVAAEKMNQANEATLENFNSMKSLMESLASVRSNAERVIPEIEISLERLVLELRTAAEKLADTVSTNSETLTNAVNNSAEELSTQIKQSLDVAHKGTTENFKAFDAQMEKELEKTLQELGSNLTSLSGKFVEDYSPLADKLRDIVRMAERVQQ